MSYKNIPASYYPAYTWLWNAAITKNEIKRQLDEMYDAGIKAFYVMGEPSDFRPTTRRTNLSPEYLSDEYTDLLLYAYLTAREKGMYMWLYNEGGYPSGMACGKLRKAHPELAMKVFEIKTITLDANTPFEYQKNLISAFVGNKRIFEGSIFTTPTDITLYSYTDATTFTDSLRIDNSNPLGTELFIKATHEKLKERFGDLMGTEITLMFDDEAYMGQWSVGLEEKFFDMHGYDIADFMPYITGTLEPKTDAQYKAKIDYTMLCGDLVRQNYFIPMKKWLNERGMLSTGHLDNEHICKGIYFNRYGNMMKTLREFDVPGVDVIWNQISYPENEKCCEGLEFFPRFASSAARQQGHSRALSESFAVYGCHVTPEYMRFVINFQAVRGISLYNFMALSYDRKTAVSTQFRPNFIGENPGMNCLSQINDYTARLSYILQNSTADITTALYYPQRTVCAGGKKGKSAELTFEELGDILEKNGVSFDIIDEDFVISSTLENGYLINGDIRYKNVFVPDADFEPADVVERLSGINRQIVPCIKRNNQCILARKIIFPDGNDGYFICNTGGETISDTIEIESQKTPYEINLYDGKITTVTHSNDNGTIKIPVTLMRGEGVMLKFSDAIADAEPNRKTEDCMTLAEFTSYISRKFVLDPHNGATNIYYTSGDDVPYEWGRDFSGEVTYCCSLPQFSDGEFTLDLGDVRHFAKVYINDKHIATSTMPPYSVYLGELKESNELKIVVSNTVANAYNNSDYFTVQDIRDVGIYHEKMKEYESQASPGGLIGPVVLKKLL